MERGDLSNAVTPRWMVTLDLLTGENVPTKRRFKSWAEAASRTEVDKSIFGTLWRLSNKVSVSFEVICFDRPLEFAEALEDQFSRKGLVNLLQINCYNSPESLMSMLPFRPDVQAVLDIQSRTWFWGKYAYSVDAAGKIL